MDIKPIRIRSIWEQPKKKRKPIGQSARTKVLLRAKGKCERCREPLGRLTPHIHHKDGNPKNNRLSNLQVICPNCHARVRKHRKPKHKEEQRFSII